MTDTEKTPQTVKDPYDAEVDFDDIVLGKDGGLPNFRQKTGLEAKNLAELAASIEANGLIERLKVWKDVDAKDSKLVTWDGERRFRAITLLKEQKRWNGTPVPVVVYERTRAEAAGLAVENYAQRSDVNAYELAVGIEQMVKAAEASGETLSHGDIAARIHKSKPWVSRNYGALERATDKLRQAWATGKLPAETVMEISQLPRADQDAAVDSQIATRSEGTKRSAGKARKQARQARGKKSDNDSGPRPSISDIRQELSVFEQVEGKDIDDPYARGVVDAFRYVNGGLDYADFGKPYQKTHEKFVSEYNARQMAAAKEKEKAEKAAAKEKATKEKAKATAKKN